MNFLILSHLLCALILILSLMFVLVILSFYPSTFLIYSFIYKTINFLPLFSILLYFSLNFDVSCFFSCLYFLFLPSFNFIFDVSSCAYTAKIILFLLSVSTLILIHLWCLFLYLFCQILYLRCLCFTFLPSLYFIFEVSSCAYTVRFFLCFLFLSFFLILTLFLCYALLHWFFPTHSRFYSPSFQCIFACWRYLWKAPHFLVRDGSGSRCSRQIVPYRSQQSAFDLWRECRTRLAPSLGDIDVGTDLSKSCRPGVLISYEIIS